MNWHKIHTVTDRLNRSRNQESNEADMWSTKQITGQQGSGVQMHWGTNSVTITKAMCSNNTETRQKSTWQRKMNKPCAQTEKGDKQVNRNEAMRSQQRPTTWSMSVGIQQQVLSYNRSVKIQMPCSEHMTAKKSALQRNWAKCHTEKRTRFSSEPRGEHMARQQMSLSLPLTVVVS